MRKGHALRRTVPARALLVIPLCLAFATGLVAPARSQVLPERRASVDVPSFSPVGSLGSSRIRPSATLLQNGKVLITGGASAYNQGVIHDSAELFDPETGTFTPLSPMTRGRTYHTATLLQTGKVLITGGSAAGTTNTVELFDPESATFTAISPMITARYGHTATLLPSGEVLIAGGFTPQGATKKAELFDPSTQTFTALPPMVTMERFLHTATLLQNGKVLLAGGSFGLGFTDKAELFDPVARTFTALPPMTSVRDEHTATLLPNGKVLLAGGRSAQGATNSTAELFDPAAGTFVPLPGMTAPREGHSATLLPSGKVLLAGGGMLGGYGSWNTAELFDPVAMTFVAILPSTMSSGRQYHVATLLPGGKVLLAGGYPGKDPVSSAFLTTKTADLFDPAVGTFTSVLPNTMAIERRGHTATVLPSGKVLITGGQTEALNTDSAELFDPVTGTFTAVGNMTQRRAYHSATLLPSGKVLIVGGWGFAYSDTAELFDPATATFAEVPGKLNVARDLHTATLLADGKILIVGGRGVTGITDTAELFDPATGTFSPIPPMEQKRINHTATLLPNGEVLIAGGIDGYAFLGAKPTNSSEIFDPVSGTFRALPSVMASPRVYHTATMLPAGKILLTGGDTGTRFANSAELFDPATETFTLLPATMTSERYGHMAIPLQDGTVLFAGGGNLLQGKNDNTAEIFDPATATFTALPPMSLERTWSTATLLVSGKVLLAGGGVDQITNTAELFDPGLGFADTRRPVVDAMPGPIVQPASLEVTGTGFRGDTEASGGSYSSSASNYPIVQLMRVDDGRTFMPVNDSAKKWSATRFSSKTFGSGTPLPAGHYRLTVSTNGIPSIQKIIVIAPPGQI